MNPDHARLEGSTSIDEIGIEQLMREPSEQSSKRRDASIRTLVNSHKDRASGFRRWNADLDMCHCPPMEIPFEAPLDGACAMFPVKPLVLLSQMLAVIEKCTRLTESEVHYMRNCVEESSADRGVPDEARVGGIFCGRARPFRRFAHSVPGVQSDERIFQSGGFYPFVSIV